VSPHETVWTIVVGGGTGQRFGGAKQYELLDDRRVIDHAVDVARSCSDGVVVVVPPADVVAEGGVPGGATRAESVRAGLGAVPGSATVVCVHDAARPLATRALFDAVVDAVRRGADGAVPGVPVTDTVKIVRGDVVVDTPDRSSLVAVQTPQAFRAAVLRAAHASGADATDDASMVERLGGRVVVVAGDPDNRKVTHPDDLVWARSVIARAGSEASA
jgi:2-C-methyl-D-erythritol 4-phosphate cytidylyltransferase